jgi:hypothetical protein
MYNHHIVEQVMLLREHGFISPDPKARDAAVKVLREEYWTERQAIVWSVDDIFRIAKDHEIGLSKEEAIGILEDVFSYADAEHGVTWNDISNAIDNHYEEREL